MAGLLERYDLKRPFGQNTALSSSQSGPVGGAAGTQFRQQESAYGRALRLLDRNARRGDARSAMLALDVREDAMNKGYAPGGIRRKAQGDADILGRISEMDRASNAMQDSLTANPNATPGAGYGRPIGAAPAAPAAPVSLADQAAAAQERSTMSGAFGEGARSRLLERKRRIAAKMTTPVEGFLPEIQMP